MNTSSTNTINQNLLSTSEMIAVCKNNVEEYFLRTEDDISIVVTDQVALSICYLENTLLNFKD